MEKDQESSKGRPDKSFQEEIVKDIRAATSQKDCITRVIVLTTKDFFQKGNNERRFWVQIDTRGP